MAKNTAIKIRGAKDITLSSPKGTMKLLYEYGELVTTAGKELKLVAEKMEEIAEAVAAYRAPVCEESKASRYASSDAAWRAGDEAETFRLQSEELSGVSLPRVLDAGTGEIVVMVGREDMA